MRLRIRENPCHPIFVPKSDKCPITLQRVEPSNKSLVQGQSFLHRSLNNIQFPRLAMSDPDTLADRIMHHSLPQVRRRPAELPQKHNSLYKDSNQQVCNNSNSTLTDLDCRQFAHDIVDSFIENIDYRIEAFFKVLSRARL